MFGGRLLSEKGRREQKEYQTCTFHGDAIINHARSGSKVGVQRKLKIERALVLPHPGNKRHAHPSEGTRRTSGGACLRPIFGATLSWDWGLRYWQFEKLLGEVLVSGVFSVECRRGDM